MPKLWTQGQNKRELRLTIERDHRIRQVMELVGQGIPVPVIAKQFQVNERQIYKDLNLIRQHFKENTLTGDMFDRVAHYNELQRMRVQRLWQLYNKEGQSDHKKILILREMRGEEELAIKKEQLIGLLPKDRPETAVQINNSISMSEEEIVKLVSRFSENQ